MPSFSQKKVNPTKTFGKINITRLILEKIQELGEATIETFFPKTYPHAAFSRLLFGIDDYPAIAPRTFSAILSRLKRQGLVGRKEYNTKTTWALTARGKVWMKQKYKARRMIPDEDGIQRLVIFDIPELHRRKRDLLRAELISCNFKPLQKSVWIGRNPLPEDFIQLLDSLQLKKYIHIFSVQNKGTLEVSAE